MIDIKKNISLASYTTFRIGGPAKFFVEVSSKDELIEALRYAKEKNSEFFILAGGSNVLVSDNGFDGLVIKIKNKKEKIKITNQNSKLFLECWAGENLVGVVNFAADNGLTGLEDLAGIPGTIGGAVRGNAGAYAINEVGIGSVAESVDIIDLDSDTNEAKKMSKEECQFNYRSSIFKNNRKLIIVKVVLRLEKGNEVEIKEKTKKTLDKRINEKPKNWVGSTGSFFRNPAVNKSELIESFEKDTGRKAIDGRLIPAFWLITEAGLSGKQMGGVKVSEKNANFIINTGGATAEDVIMLACFIKQQVRDKFGIELQEEVQYVGF
jgi:UDP-N-acetylmuramate dehydrogenase